MIYKFKLFSGAVHDNLYVESFQEISRDIIFESIPSFKELPCNIEQILFHSSSAYVIYGVNPSIDLNISSHFDQIIRFLFS